MLLWYDAKYIYAQQGYLIVVFIDLLHLIVPRQRNGFDCGLFLCRYVLGFTNCEIKHSPMEMCFTVKHLVGKDYK